MHMKEITSFFAEFPEVWSVKVVPVFVTSVALGPLASLMLQTYELAEVNAAEPLRVTVLGPLVFGIVKLPATPCCVGRSVPFVL
jgi:hypothetical protein